MTEEKPPAAASEGPPEPMQGSPPTPVPEPRPEVEDAQRPTPVRVVMEPGGAEEDPESNLRTLEDSETGLEWVVRVSGRSGGGILPLRTIPLLHLTFTPPADSDLPLRRGVFPGETLYLC